MKNVSLVNSGGDEVKKRILSVVLMLVMLVTVAPMPWAGAAESYRWPVPSSTKVTQKYSAGHTAIDIGGTKVCDVVAT